MPFLLHSCHSSSNHATYFALIHHQERPPTSTPLSQSVLAKTSHRSETQRHSSITQELKPRQSSNPCVAPTLSHLERRRNGVWNGKRRMVMEVGEQWWRGSPMCAGRRPSLYSIISAVACGTSGPVPTEGYLSSLISVPIKLSMLTESPVDRQSLFAGLFVLREG